MQQALLLIDIQNDYFPGGRMELANMPEAAARAARLLEWFRDHRQPVLHIQHISRRAGATFFLPETDGVMIHASVTPRGGELLVPKSFPNSFRGTLLLDRLQHLDIDTLVICGAMSHMCIDATTRAAFDHGFDCTVIEDACSTRDLEFRGVRVGAAEVHAAFMAALAAPYARVLGCDEYLAAQHRETPR